MLPGSLRVAADIVWSQNKLNIIRAPWVNPDHHLWMCFLLPIMWNVTSFPMVSNLFGSIFAHPLVLKTLSYPLPSLNSALWGNEHIKPVQDPNSKQDLFFFFFFFFPLRINQVIGRLINQFTVMSQHFQKWSCHFPLLQQPASLLSVCWYDTWGVQVFALPCNSFVNVSFCTWGGL